VRPIGPVGSRLVNCHDALIVVAGRILTVPYTVTTVTITVNYGSLTGRNRKRKTCPGPLYGTVRYILRDVYGWYRTVKID
jgi:hypothetical protein